MSEHIVGKTIFIDKQPIMLYSRFSDLQSIAAAIPEENRKMAEVTRDSVLVRTHGMELGLKLTQSIPFNTLVFEQMGQTPFPFQLKFHFDPAVAKDGATDFHMELNAEMNAMMKMMLGGKLRNFVDSVTDAISDIAQGRVPEGLDDYVI